MESAGFRAISSKEMMEVNGGKIVGPSIFAVKVAIWILTGKWV